MAIRLLQNQVNELTSKKEQVKKENLWKSGETVPEPTKTNQPYKQTCSTIEISSTNYLLPHPKLSTS